jgi:hypothetical protein
MASARSNSFRPFTPDPAQMALKPEVSGNAINGLNEPQARAPRMVYWAPNPDDIPHGAMQRWFYQVDPANPDLARAREDRARMLAQPVAALQGAPVQQAPDTWTRSLQDFVSGADIDLVGGASKLRSRVSSCWWSHMTMRRFPLHRRQPPAPKSCANTAVPAQRQKPSPAGSASRAGTPNR